MFLSLKWFFSPEQIYYILSSNFWPDQLKWFERNRFCTKWTFGIEQLVRAKSREIIFYCVFFINVNWCIDVLSLAKISLLHLSIYRHSYESWSWFVSIGYTDINILQKYVNNAQFTLHLVRIHIGILTFKRLLTLFIMYICPYLETNNNITFFPWKWFSKCVEICTTNWFFIIHINCFTFLLINFLDFHPFFPFLSNRSILLYLGDIHSCIVYFLKSFVVECWFQVSL